MNARTQAQRWLAGGDTPEAVIPRMARDVLDADEDSLPLMLRAMTYMVEALTPRAVASALLQAVEERRFLPEEGAVHAALRAEVAALTEANAEAAGQFQERRLALRQVEEQVAMLAEEVARLRAVLTALPDEGGAP